MIEVFWPENTQPQTTEPLYSLKDGFLHLENNAESKDASIGFSYDGKNWEVYSEPIEVKTNKKIYFKAVRYGWKESETKIVKF